MRQWTIEEIDALEEEVNKYLSTLDDIDCDERCETEREFAVDGLYGFLSMLKRESGHLEVFKEREAVMLRKLLEEKHKVEQALRESRKQTEMLREEKKRLRAQKYPSLAASENYK